MRGSLERFELSSRYILVGLEDSGRQQAIVNNLAPRIDYRLVAERCGANIRQWLPSPAGLRGPRPVRIARSLLGNLRHAASLVRSLPPGAVVYATGETWGLPVGLVGALQRRRRFAHVVYVHRVFSPAWLRFLRTSRGWLAVDGWICVTRHQARLLRDALGPDGAPVAVVSQGVDTQFFDPARARPPAGRPYLLSVGVEMRNYDLFFQAVRDLEIDVVVKASSAWMASARQEIGAAPPNVRLITERLSYVALRDLYAGAALVVAPLYDTPQAAGITTILEAMAMGKAVVATRSAGLPDVLAPGDTGIVVEPDAHALAAALQQLLDDPARRQTLAEAGRRAVLETVTLEHHADQVVEFLLAVAQTRQ